MDDQQTPTLLDLAKVLDSLALSDCFPECRPALSWLIRQSPKAQAVYDELNSDTGDRPTLLELAKLVCAVETNADYPECQHTAMWLIRQSEAARNLYAELERMATDAGTDLDKRATDVIRWHQRRIVEAQDFEAIRDAVDTMSHRGAVEDLRELEELIRKRRAEAEARVVGD